MNRYRLQNAARLTLGLTLFIALTSSALSQTNLLTVNAGFETNPNSFLGGVGTFAGITGWQVVGTGTGSGPIVGVSTDQPNVTGREGSAVAYCFNGSFETAAANRPTVTAGARYLVRVLVESDLAGSANFTIGVRWYNDTTNYTALSASSQSVTAENLSAFQARQFIVFAPAGATRAGFFAQTGSDIGVLLDQIQLYDYPVAPAGTPIEFPPQANRTVTAALPLQVTNTILYQGLPRSGLTYSLIAPPPGSTISSDGVINWTPSVNQAGSTYTITTRAVDDSDHTISTENSFQVSVVVPPPTLGTAVRRSVTLGSTLRFVNPNTKPNLPNQLLSYQLVNPPPGATIDSSGTITFTPTRVGPASLTTQLVSIGPPSTTVSNTIVVDVLTPIAPGSPNLLTVNPGFETGALNTFTNGAYSFTGWNGVNLAFSQHAIYTGVGTEGGRYLRQEWGGILSTAAAARPVASPGQQFELRVDLRALIRNFPDERLGTQCFIEFFNASGTLLKQVWGPNWAPGVQFLGRDAWETFTVRGVAPTGTASVGVRVQALTGRFVSDANNYTLDRHVEVDNVRLYNVPETVDQIAYRRAPRLVEPGQSVVLKINTAAPAARTLRAALVTSSGTEIAAGAVAVAAGRFRAVPVNVSIPGDLANGTYSWRITLSSAEGGTATATQTIPEVTVDQTVAGPDLSETDFRADHPNIQYMGRVENLANGSRWLHWLGSEVRLRFSGTALSMTVLSSDNGFGGYDPNINNTVYAVVGGDYANPRAILIPQVNSVVTVPIVSGLADGIHTVSLFKSNETDQRIRFDSFRVDANRGLLPPERLSNRRLEIYGDSVTNGSEAGPNFFGYAPLIGRELDTDLHIIAKGGTGVAASFSGQSLLLNYWDNLTYSNVFFEEGGLPWNTSSWVPHVAVSAIGHNDQFNGGGLNFGANYALFYNRVRAAYPSAKFIALNTTISNPINHFRNAITPLQSDPSVAFAFQLNPSDNLVFSHPDRAGHAAMAQGDTYRFSLADLIEDQAGWGFDSAASGYNLWVLENYSSAQLALGQQAYGADPLGQGVSNLQRYAFGLTSTSNATPANLTTLGLDAQGRLTLTFFRARPDVTYTVEGSSDLVTWTTLATNPGALGQTVMFIDPTVAPSRRFLRLRVTIF